MRLSTVPSGAMSALRDAAPRAAAAGATIEKTALSPERALGIVLGVALFGFGTSLVALIVVLLWLCR